MRTSYVGITTRALDFLTGPGRLPTSLMLVFVSVVNAAEWYRDTFHPLGRLTRGDPIQGAFAVTVAAAAFLLTSSPQRSGRLSPRRAGAIRAKREHEPESVMADELMRDLPGDLPAYLARFGTDAQCRAYLVRARWPEGFCCAGCGHERAYSHRARLIEECAACGKQHSLLAGTIFAQTKTGVARWFLAIWLVTSSKGGISAMELQRQMGFSSYQTASSWRHKIRKAMVRPGRAPLADRLEADETLLGGATPGKRGRGAAGNTVVAGAVEAGRGRSRGRRLGRLRLQAVADASAASLHGFLDVNTTKPVTVATDGWAGYRDLATAGYRHEPINLSRSWGEASLRLPGHPPRLQPRPTLALGHASRRRPTQASPSLSRRGRLPLQPAHRQEHRPPLRPADRAGRPNPAHHLPPPRPERHDLKVMES